MKDATIRSGLLIAVGVLLLALLPATALGEEPLWLLASQPGPTLANLVGIVPIVAAWLYFLVVVVVLRAVRRRDVVCRVALACGVLALATAVVTLLWGWRPVALGALLAAAASQLVVAWRLWRPAALLPRTEAEVGAGLT